MAESWDELLASLLVVYGLKAWGTRLGEHSVLIVELGEADADDVRGAYQLWIHGAAWRLETADAVLAASQDEGDDLAERVSVLNGRTLASVAVERRSLSARFSFDGGPTLSTFSLYSHGHPHWALERPDGSALLAGPGSSWSIIAAEER